ncbi:hypothetical protein C8Q78DRAFT_1049962 [Trametes maxima]|nr:hypothetical protein C8Q78DRAFT_1049962 [Trametes maxima]
MIPLLLCWSIQCILPALVYAYAHPLRPIFHDLMTYLVLYPRYNSACSILLYSCPVLGPWPHFYSDAGVMYRAVHRTLIRIQRYY